MSFPASTTTAPAAPAAASSFFGGGAAAAATAPTPAGGGTFNFGAPAPANAPAAPSTTTGGFGGGGFGGAPAAPAAPGGGFSFGGTPAPAAPSSAFGGGGGAFGAAPTGAAAGGSIFASTTPAAPSSSPFAASTAFGSPPAAAQQQQPQQQPAPAATIAGSMQYQSLTPEMKQKFDSMHEAIMRHKHTLLDLQSMGPQVLQKPQQPGHQGHGHYYSSGTGTSATSTTTTTTPLQDQLKRLGTMVNRLQQEITQSNNMAQTLNKECENSVAQAMMYAQWPVEAHAVRRGVRLTALNHQEEKKGDDGAAAALQNKIREALNRGMASVDRIERIPSPYYWDLLHELEKSTAHLSNQATSLESQLDQSRAMTHLAPEQIPPTIDEIIETQHVALARLVGQMEQLRTEVERIRFRYGQYERGENVLDKARVSDLERQRKLHEQVQLQFLQADNSAATTTPAPASGPTSGFGGFGNPAAGTPNPAPAPSIFSSPAPAPGGLFSGGGTPAPAPGGSAFSFPPSTSSSSKKKQSSRSSGRLNKR